MPSLKASIFSDPPVSYLASVNPYLKTLKDNRQSAALPLCFGEDLKDLAFNWEKTFSKQNSSQKKPEKIILEIGIHKGLILTQMAKDHPSWSFVGCDITYKRVVSSAQKLLKEGLTNAICLLANAKQIGLLFEPSSLDGVVIFFPDPWNKKPKQAVHRLITEDFCKDLYAILKPGGSVWLKTDAISYFQNSELLFQKSGFSKKTNENPLFSKHYTSVFEERFAQKAVPTYSGVWMKTFPADNSDSL